MQESQWRLEERIKDVEALNRQLCEDLAKKQTILRDYMLTIKGAAADVCVCVCVYGVLTPSQLAGAGWIAKRIASPQHPKLDPMLCKSWRKFSKRRYSRTFRCGLFASLSGLR